MNRKFLWKPTSLPWGWRRRNQLHRCWSLRSRTWQTRSVQLRPRRASSSMRIAVVSRFLIALQICQLQIPAECQLKLATRVGKETDGFWGICSRLTWTLSALGLLNWQHPRTTSNWSFFVGWNVMWVPYSYFQTCDPKFHGKSHGKRSQETVSLPRSRLDVPKPLEYLRPGNFTWPVAA